MRILCAALLAAASSAAMAQTQSPSPTAPPASAGAPLPGAVPAGPVFTLDQAVVAAGGTAPALEVGAAGVQAAQAGRTVAGLRPNPVLQAQVENVVGTGPYRGIRSAETTVGVALPIELGGKRGARIAVANAQLSRAEIQAAILAADVRLQVTQLYVEAVAAERRVLNARDQLRIAGEAARGAGVRVQAGRASPLEQQRAEVNRVNAEANVERLARLAEAARVNLAARIGRPVTGSLDIGVIDRLPALLYGPQAPLPAVGTLALAAAEADLAVADAGVRLARANRVPDLNVGPAIRWIKETNDTAAVFTVSLPLPIFNNGRAAVAQATAERTRAFAQTRLTQLDIEQAIVNAQVEAANAATTARTAAGPALAAAQEAARIARIGYREGKFGQLELLDAERTLAETRVAAIDALATYQNARARLERLTVPAPTPNGGNQ